jgi:hypothetical protein
MGHILGSAGLYSGIGMHLGHYKAHMDFMISMGSSRSVQGFFNKDYWIEFITVGVALWSRSLPKQSHAPCCDLDHIGGDGTGIGISLYNVMHLSPIWHPEELKPSPDVEWGRLDRCCIASPKTLPKEQREGIASAKNFCKELLSCTPDERLERRHQLTEHEKYIPADVFGELCRWVGGDLEEFSEEWLVLQRLMQSCFTDECVLGIVPSCICDPLQDLLLAVNPSNQLASLTSATKDRVQAELCKLQLAGMGDDIADLIRCQTTKRTDQHWRLQLNTYKFLLFLGTQKPHVIGCCVY